MGVLVAITIGLIFWLTAWALGWKAFDAFMVTIALALIAITIRVAKPYVDRMLGNEPAEEL